MFGWSLLQEYLRDSNHPFLPLTRIGQSQNSPEFEAAFDDRAAVSSIASHAAMLTLLICSDWDQELWLSKLPCHVT